MSIAVVVVSLPERHQLLAEAIASVYAQVWQPDDLVVGVDYSRVGEVWNNNRCLLATTDTDYVAFLHDDDLWEPRHLLNAVGVLDGGADVAVADFELVGRAAHTIEPFHDDWSDLLRTNWFPPSTVVARRSVFGLWTEPEFPPPRDWVDWSAWRRLYNAGARFERTRESTVKYRFLGGNGSWG